ncbi:hypothetical protein FA15DRAFT_226442 [Coprinopsis marcescibilis]|uniref:Uncharacterized protein n=1 Tax=Coprinopsis marcescibilis TaxID=230819 RepID=A0A5C3L306_COPMA|nr:hypothetical protein FA15DRAFT_226442 [Coprinopsis marcescibilis]
MPSNDVQFSLNCDFNVESRVLLGLISTMAEEYSGFIRLSYAQGEMSILSAVLEFWGRRRGSLMRSRCLSLCIRCEISVIPIQYSG